MAAREIRNGNGKGASKSKRVQELDNLLSTEEVGDLIIGLNLMEDSSLVEKGSTKDEMGAQRNMRDNLDQLWPKVLRAQDAIMEVGSEHSLSFSPKIHFVFKKCLKPSEVELKMDDGEEHGS